MELQVTTMAGTKATALKDVAENIFSAEFNEALVHQIVTAYLAGARRGTRAQKTRSEVSGSTAKPWRQKGTGRARAGTIRSPIWRKGGVTFAAKPQNYKQKVNRKMYRSAMCSILSELLRQERLLVVDEFKLESHKTRELVDKLKNLALDNVLIITEEFDKNLELAAGNIPHVDVIKASAVGPLNLIRFDKVVVTAAAIKQIEEVLA